jgi:hypothetical protein
MRQEDYGAFVAVMSAVAETLGYPKLAENGMKLFFDLLKPYTFEQVARALHVHLLESPYMPKPVDIISRIDGSVDDRAIKAWHRVLEAARQHGAYESVKFDDPVIHFCIERMGGWQKVCMMTEDELPFRERDFRELYKLGRNVGWKDVPKYFPGHHEINNRINGYLEFIPALVEIVDTETKRLAAGMAYKELAGGK